jgi:hypothetical protein
MVLFPHGRIGFRPPHSVRTTLGICTARNSLLAQKTRVGQVTPMQGVGAGSTWRLFPRREQKGHTLRNTRGSVMIMGPPKAHYSDALVQFTDPITKFGSLLRPGIGLEFAHAFSMLDGETLRSWLFSSSKSTPFHHLYHNKGLTVHEALVVTL